MITKGKRWWGNSATNRFSDTAGVHYFLGNERPITSMSIWSLNYVQGSCQSVYSGRNRNEQTVSVYVKDCGLLEAVAGTHESWVNSRCYEHGATPVSTASMSAVPSGNSCCNMTLWGVPQSLLAANATVFWKLCSWEGNPEFTPVVCF
jgi:hypothetical protein